MKFVATFGLPLLLLASTVAAECAESEPSRVFSYSVGEKRVSVSKSGDRFFYHFGAARKDEMSIVGVPATGNIFQECSASLDRSASLYQFSLIRTHAPNPVARWT